MAVASDLPQIENQRQFGAEHNSYLYDDMGRPIGLFAPPNHDVIDDVPAARQVHAVTRSSRSRTSASGTTPGIDLQGRRRARSWPTPPAEPPRAPRRSPSSSSRTRSPRRATGRSSRSCARPRWPSTSPTAGASRRSSREYLNSIYFGNGAYGIESAARVYFGSRLGLQPGHHRGRLEPAAAPAPRSSTSRHAPRCCAPSRRRCWPAWSPTRPRSTRSSTRRPPTHRRNLVLQDMLAQHYISRRQYEYGHQPRGCRTTRRRSSSRRSRRRRRTSPAGSTPDPRRSDRAGQGRVPRLLRRPEDPHHDRPQDAAGRRAGDLRGAPERRGRPTASLVAIDNETGQVRAMVGGPLVNGHQDYEQYPFNLATQGERQPGSSFKPFTLAVALAARLHARLGVRLTAAEPDRPQQRRQGASTTSTTTTTSTADRSRSPRRPPSPTTAFHPARPVARRRHQADRRDGQADGHPLRPSRPTPR